MDRPALSRILDLVHSRQVDVIVVYKLDRLSRSLADFVRLIELFDAHDVSFVSITQQFNTSTSMGRLTLNVLLSFAQFEREVTGERIRDKIAASKKKGMWMGGRVPLGYDLTDRELCVNEREAAVVRHIFNRYLALGCVRKLKTELDDQGYRSKPRPDHHKISGEKPFSRGVLYALLKNPLYIGKVHHDGTLYEANHSAIVDAEVWDAVQTKLRTNRTRHKARGTAKHPSLLAGRVVDDKGNRLSPTYTQKRNKRYGYYINQALLQFREDDALAVKRIPAVQLDNAVEELVMDLIGNPTSLLDHLTKNLSDAHDVERALSHAQQLNETWRSFDTATKIKTLAAIDLRVTVESNRVDLSLCRQGLSNLLLNQHHDSATTESRSPDPKDRIALSAAIDLRRSGIGKRLIVGNTRRKPPKAHPRSVRALQRNVLNALRWNQELITGAVASIDALVNRDGLNRRQVYRIRQLAFLAPDIIERIAEGDIPDTLTLEKLKKGFPMDWEEQRHLFGIR